mgnify:CR=1 FL=1
MQVSVETEDIHAETVVIMCSKAEYAAMKYYAEYYSEAAASQHTFSRTVIIPAVNAAARYPGSKSLFNFSKEFQDKLFR